MNLKIHHYQLPILECFPRAHSGKGVLLALEGENNQFGYADLHPWTTLGDLDVHEQLRLLQQGTPTLQTLLSLEYANRDLQAKVNKSGGIRSLKEIKNHYLVLENLTTMDHLENFLIKTFKGHTLLLKLKLTPQSLTSLPSLLNSAANQYPFIRWRLDANSLLNFQEICLFWKKLSDQTQKQIQFIEDPCLYDRKSWMNLENEGIPLAIDFEIKNWKNSKELTSPTPSGKTIFVLKPAIQNMNQWKEFFLLNPHYFMITSYLDHPVGLLHALWTAESFYEIFPKYLLPCGLSFPFYQQQLDQIWDGLSLDPIHHSWSTENSLGIGYSQILKELPWQTLNTL